MAAGAVIRIGSAVGKAAPAVLDQAMKYYRTATKGKVNTPAQAVEFAKRGVAQASIIAQGLAKGGMPVAEILPADVARGDSALTALHTSLNQMYGVIGSQFNADRSDSPIHTDNTDTAKDAIRKQLLMTVRRAFGSLDNAQRVAVALETLDTNDYRWGKEVLGL